MESITTSTPKRSLPALLLPLHGVPVAIFIAVGWWYGHTSSPWRSDPLFPVFLLYGLPSAIALWRIGVLCVAAGIVESSAMQARDLSIQSLILTQPRGRALEVALWVGVPAAYGLYIVRHAPWTVGGLQSQGFVRMTPFLMVPLLGALAQQTRVCAAALEISGGTGPHRLARTLTRPAAFLTWLVWVFLPVPLCFLAFLGQFFSLSGTLEFTPCTFVLIDLPMLCLLAYSALRLTLCLRATPSVRYERGTTS